MLNQCLRACLTDNYLFVEELIRVKISLPIGARFGGQVWAEIGARAAFYID